MERVLYNEAFTYVDNMIYLLRLKEFAGTALEPCLKMMTNDIMTSDSSCPELYQTDQTVIVFKDGTWTCEDFCSCHKWNTSVASIYIKAAYT